MKTYLGHRRILENVRLPSHSYVKSKGGGVRSMLKYGGESEVGFTYFYMYMHILIWELLIYSEVFFLQRR